MRNHRSSRVTMGVLFGEARNPQFKPDSTPAGLRDASPKRPGTHFYRSSNFSCRKRHYLYTFSGALAYRYAVATQAACKVHGVGEAHCCLSGLNLI